MELATFDVKDINIRWIWIEIPGIASHPSEIAMAVLN
jgi:hypothetical protein